MRTVGNSRESESLFNLIRYRNTSSALDHFDLNHVRAMCSGADDRCALVRNVHDAGRFETRARVYQMARERKNSASAEIQWQAQFEPATFQWEIGRE